MPIYELLATESGADNTRRKITMTQDLYADAMIHHPDPCVGVDDSGANFILTEDEAKLRRYHTLIDMTKNWLLTPEYGYKRIIKFLANIARFEEVEHGSAVTTLEELRDLLPEPQYLDLQMVRNLYGDETWTKLVNAHPN